MEDQNVILKELAEQMRQGFNGISNRFDKVEKDIAGLNSKIDLVRTELSARIEMVRGELNTKIESVEAKLSAKIESVEAKLSAKIELVEAELSAKIESVRVELNAKIESEIENLALMTKNGFDASDRKFEELEHQIAEIKNFIVTDSDKRFTKLENAVFAK